MNTPREWKPATPKELKVERWLRRAMRYGVGGGGLVWAMATDHLEPVLLLVLGAIATSTDVAKFAIDLIRAAKEEEELLEHHALIHHEKERRSEGSDI